MGLPNVMQTGVSGMMASKAAVATTGHNITNANTEGYSRQRVELTTNEPETVGPHSIIGRGNLISSVKRSNDEYLEKQIRGAGRDMAHFEEKEVALKQTEDIFNEMNGDGLNRLMTRFFNEFRRLSNEPESEAVRQSVREATQAVVNDFHRIRGEVEDVRKHIDSRIEGYCSEMNSIAKTIADLNMRTVQMEAGGAVANDLEDQRDVALKKLATYLDVSTHKNGVGSIAVDARGIGPIVSDVNASVFSVSRAPADPAFGKPEGALEIATTGSATGAVTHQIQGGKLGALVEVRDQLLGGVLDRLDEMAFSLSRAVNEVHSNGFTRAGSQGVNFFGHLDQKARAAEFIDLSDAVKSNVGNIATAAASDSPGDNRIALAISGLQSQKLMNNGTVTADDWYNSIVSDVGVMGAQNKSQINQQKEIVQSLGKMREQISGVSIDEETANLMQFQHTYDASAKVIQVADEMLKTVLELKR